MRPGNTSKSFPDNPEEVESAIGKAPERVYDPESPYDPNDPGAVEAFWKNASVRRPGQRGPGRKAKKVLLSVRYSPEVVEYFKSTGEGWQRRMDDALKEWMASRHPERMEQRFMHRLGRLAEAMSRIVGTRPLKRLAETMSEMARTGELRSDFPASGGSSEVRQIEETFRGLIVSLEEQQRARERSYIEAIGALVTAGDARDHETTGHSFRVALYANSLAKTLGLRGDDLKAIEYGALLHDIGKMVVPDEILRKIGPLTEEEWKIMRHHPVWGFDMLAEVSFLQPAALDIIYCHHERWDGKGYPRGLAGESIPLSARIFAVVDTYDNITSDRPYRRARSHKTAMDELRRMAGQQFDPKVVEVFSEIPEVELRRLRELTKRIHPGLSLPKDLLDAFADPEPEQQMNLGA